MKPIGYTALIKQFDLKVLTPKIRSYLLDRGQRSTREADGRREEYYPPRDDPGDSWTDNLGFALKREGVNLETLAALFRTAPEDELVAWMQSAPTGRHTRVARFLCEWLLGRPLPLPDLTQGNYVPVLDENKYYALNRSGKELNSKRHRVVNNLPGTPEYCPLVRRTEELKKFEAMRLDEQALEKLKQYPEELLNRAAQYLYLKEIKSSYAIERLTPDQRRTARFVALLREAGKRDCYTIPELVQMQNTIVEEDYIEKDIRSVQNYVGQSLGPARELVHYVAPKPEDIGSLIKGWMTCCRRMQEGAIHPMVRAAVAGFGFVFLHPFEDGNGRLHRFLIHHELAVGKFSPPGIIFPVSATMLKQDQRYEAALEAYSLEVGQHVEYTLDDLGAMEVTNDTASFYQYPDLTPQAEALFGFIKDTIEMEMVAELDYLAVFDAARQKMRSVVDMPDRRLDLFLRLCLQGKGRLSKTKRAQFEELSDEVCETLEGIVQEAIAQTS